MTELNFFGFLKLIAARLLCLPAIASPYRVRVYYVRTLAFVVHTPFKIFGRIGRFLCERLELEDEIAPPPPAPDAIANRASAPPRADAAVVLFSGGTDSTCAAFLSCERHSEVHLLTFFEEATRHSPEPLANFERLKTRFPDRKLLYRRLPVDQLVRFLSYERYGHTLRQHGWLALATCGFSSLSWHVRTIQYCLEHGIRHVSDGLTRELMHFPGHMDEVVSQFRALYADFGITYENPVRDWPTPPDQQLIDKVIVNRHGNDFVLGDSSVGQRKTTGKFLFDHGVFPAVNVKGSKLDFTMQHDCYPFALYNIIAFWGYLPAEPYPVFCARVARLMQEKIETARRQLL